ATISLADILCLAAVMATFLRASEIVRFMPDARNLYLLLALLIFAFQSAFVLYDVYGILDAFQIILSAFWLGSAFMLVAAGIYRETKMFRLFGLVLAVGTVLKIGVVDIWLLNAYSQSTTLLLTGGLLLAI